MGTFSDNFAAASGGGGGQQQMSFEEPAGFEQPQQQDMGGDFGANFTAARDAALAATAKKGSAAAAPSPLDQLKFQQETGKRQAAIQGGYQGQLEYLRQTDPAAALDLEKKQQEYVKGVNDTIYSQTQNDKARLDLEKEHNLFVANVYSVIQEQADKDPNKGAQLYQKFLPEIKKYDSNAPDTYDPDRANIAIGQAVDAKVRWTNRMQEEAADKANERELRKPYTELGKQQADLKQAILRGDMIAATDLQQQITDNQLKLSAERIKASGDVAGSLRKEHTELSKNYIIARSGYGQAVTGLGSNTPEGDMAGVIGVMQLVNPQLQLQPGKALDAASAPGINQSLIDTYNMLMGSPDKGLDDATRKGLMDQAQLQFNTRTAQQKQLDEGYANIAKQQGLDPKTVVLDFSPAVSHYTPEQEAQLRQMSEEKINMMMEQAKARGANMEELQQKRQAIEQIRKAPVEAIQRNASNSSIEQSLYKLAPRANPAIVTALAQNVDVLEKYGINTPTRQRAFAAQMAHESGGFTATTERISNANADRNYGGRMGNNNPGDGSRYKGRGIIQLTGKDNYRQYSQAAGVDLVAHPELAADPNIAIKVAAAYWSDHQLNHLADNGDIRGITKRINGGYNGLNERVKYQRRAENLGLFASLGGK